MGFVSLYEDISDRWADSQGSQRSTSNNGTGQHILIHRREIESMQREIKVLRKLAKHPNIDVAYELAQLQKRFKESQREKKLLEDALKQERKRRNALSLQCKELEYRNKVLEKRLTTLEIQAEQEKERKMKAKTIFLRNESAFLIVDAIRGGF